MSGLLAAMMTFVTGLLLGAAIQRWGDRDRATEHHTRYVSETDEEIQSDIANFGLQFVGHGSPLILEAWADLDKRLGIDQ